MGVNINVYPVITITEKKAPFFEMEHDIFFDDDIEFGLCSQ